MEQQQYAKPKKLFQASVAISDGWRQLISGCPGTAIATFDRIIEHEGATIIPKLWQRGIGALYML